MKKNKERSKYISYLKGKIDLNKEKLPEKVTRDFKRFKLDWIKQAMSEWAYKKGKHEYQVLERFPNEEVHCQLCNAPLTKTVVFVVNLENGRELHIGTDCVANVLSQNVITRNQYSGIAYERYERLEKKYPSILEFNNNIHPSKTAKYELSAVLLKKETQLFRKIKKVIDEYCKQGIYHESEFKEIKNEIVEYQDNVNAFVNRNGAERGLSFKLKNRMQQNHNPKLNEIKRIVHKSKGILTTEAAMLIEDSKYLDEYAEKVNINGLHNQLSLFQHRQGITFAMGLDIYKWKVCLEFPSMTVIKYFTAPDPAVTALGIKNIIRASYTIKPSGEEDETTLFLAGSELLKKKNLNIYRPSFKLFMNYVKKRESHFSSEDKTRISNDKYQQLISKTVFLKNNDQVATMTKEEIITTGIQYLRSIVLDNIPDISWPSLKNKSLVMQDIYTDLQI
ncbi:hypothetical protein [Bombilactobacillus bombi]|uniref:hypothetical protein n=1 Tax=Bombilactobacillus bombi TaxID=1303590 RepID=UPI0015E60204|nr:hypothetical protein [Bombilactobacillus bombi]MBA1435196.1 hypothetical protein [Bombilactobacillus bombi]